MATYFATIATSLRRVSPAFSYEADSKSLVAEDSRVEFETGDDYFAVKVNGDYSMVLDSDGLLVGDFESASTPSFPRLEFFRETCGIKQRMASLTSDGRLSVSSVTESDTLPDGMNLWDEVVFHSGGVTAKKVNEVWFLAQDGNYVVTDSGLLIRVRTAVEA